MAGTECRTNAISNQHTLSVCTASGKISCGWSHQQPAFLSATQCLKEVWEVKKAWEVARLAYAGMAVRCKGRSSSGAVDRQSGAREEAAAIHLMFCFVGAAGCSGVQRGAAGCSIGAAGVQRGVASKMSTAYLRRAFYSLWMAGWPSAAGWLSGAAMGSGVAMDKVHCMQFAWAFLAPWFRFFCFGRVPSRRLVV